MKNVLSALFAAIVLGLAAAMPARAANDRDLAAAMSKEVGIPKAQAERALVSLTNTIAAYLKKGTKVTLKDLGDFSVSQRKASTGKDPKTGKTINVQAGKVAKFNASKRLEATIK